MKKRILLLFLTVFLLVLCTVSFAEVSVPCADGEITLTPVMINGEEWYFLPAFAGNELCYQKNAFTLDSLLYDEKSEEWSGEVCGSEIHLMRGSLRSLFLYSSDPVNLGRAWVDNCEFHRNETTGTMKLYDISGTPDSAGELASLRGRGNSTWDYVKKPYQIKLKNKQNLLKTNDEKQAAKKWVLLAEYCDPTLLCNRIGLSLALEAGLSDTPESESVDLYYDGEYRGVYTLCEKVEVNKGRVQLTEMQDQQDQDTLSFKSGENAYGLEIHYAEGGTGSEDPSRIGYLIEMEGVLTLDEESCWFTLSNGSVMSVKYPEAIGYQAMCYISEKAEELWLTAQNGGIHPQTGAKLEDKMDLDSFARVLLVYDTLYCHDGMCYSSSFFKLEAQSEVFTAGPVWDFDLGTRYLMNGDNAGGFGMRSYDRNLWYAALHSCPCMQQKMLEIWQTEMRNLTVNLLLDDEAEGGDYLQSLNSLHSAIAPSRKMNVKLYGISDSALQRYGSTIEQDISLQREFLEKRVQWIDVSLGHMYSAAVDTVCLQATTDYTDPEDSFQIKVLDCFNAAVSGYSIWQETEADEENYALYGVSVEMTPDEACHFSEPVLLYVNGISVPCEISGEGLLTAEFYFEDLTYRPLDADGEDYGLIVNLDWLRENYPEAAEIYASDEELLGWFTTEGMENGQQGNAYFAPRVLRNYCADLGLAGEYVYDYQSYLDWGQYEWDLTEYELELNLRYAPVPLLR